MPVVGLPTGTVTFLFTDIEGSTRLLGELGDDYGPIQDDHMRLLRAAIAAGEGTEIRTEGDAFFAVFPSAAGAVRAAVEAQRALAAHTWPHGKPLRVRMGMHTGEGRLGGDDYLGIDVNRAARVAAVGHGGQVLVSEATRVLVEHELPRGVRLRELGEHRLKDLARPESLHDLVIEGLPSDFPPLRTLEVPTNLPSEVTSFVGRERDIAMVEELLGSSRLVTLTGPGGSGKTRLALRVASDMLDRFPDGVLLVELASIREPHLVAGAIATVLGIREEGSRPVEELLQLELRHRTALLVLDNFEQVVEAAPLLGYVLAAAPDLRILATSRGPLRIQGEQNVSVGPLDLPDGVPPPEEFDRYGALALFVDRGRSIDPSFAVDEGNAPTVVEICRRLDGLPLALELAASRLRLLTPDAILERLDRALPLLAGGSRDLPERQRTLRGAIGWSYDLLPPPVAALFRRLCVFAGGFDIEAAEALADPGAEGGVGILDGLEVLLDGSLVRRRTAPNGAGRFEALQTIREFGLERLDDEGEALAVHRRHAEHYLGVADAAREGLRGPEIERSLGVLQVEHDNLRAALAWAIVRDEGEIGLRLIRCLWRFWHFHGHLTAGRRWAEQALALPSAAGRTAARAWALIANGGLAYWQRDVSAAAQSYGEALAIFRDLQDEAGVAEGTYNHAYVPLLAGDLDEAEASFEQSRALFDQRGDRRGVADSLFGLAVTMRLRGDVESARTHAERSLELHAASADLFGIASARVTVARAAAEMGDLDTARRLFLETLQLAERMRDLTGVAVSLDNLAAHAWARGRGIRALRLAGASEATKERVGGEAPPEIVDLPDLREQARGALPEETIAAAWEEGRALRLEEALAMAREDES